jgi:hypothetical protein
MERLQMQFHNTMAITSLQCDGDHCMHAIHCDTPCCTAPATQQCNHKELSSGLPERCSAARVVHPPPLGNPAVTSFLPILGCRTCTDCHSHPQSPEKHMPGSAAVLAGTVHHASLVMRQQLVRPLCKGTEGTTARTLRERIQHGHSME